MNNEIKSETTFSGTLKKSIRKLPISRYLQIMRYNINNSKEEKYPFYASFKVTSRCHFHCKFCDMKDFITPDMSTEECLNILRNLGRSSIFLLSLEGGEPLLRNDIEDLIKEARKQPYYLLFTTSQKNLLDYPWERYQNYIDFLHISIDEGHENLHLFDALKTINSYKMVVCVQTVVAKEDQPFLEDKIRKCYEANCKILVMPAVQLDGMKDQFPDFDKLAADIKIFKERYPHTIITPDSYFRQVKKEKGGCSPASIIIDADGSLFYPCRTLRTKQIKMQESDLMNYLKSSSGSEMRKVMHDCTRQCGWYQYFATSRFSTLQDFKDAAGPYLKEFFGGRKIRL